jgi:hypothetical protein
MLDLSGSEQGQVVSSCEHRTFGFPKILGISWYSNKFTNQLQQFFYSVVLRPNEGHGLIEVF